ncbi:hypothetical protein C8046_15180 [Serinibacter arcticus]|uniref:IPT/TIG domain-containing protein n=1 Tax=Serinibacter arcticus TaxID=1655435 RepID=A0A2U1ZXS1_9MICO|nr:IPT/TIG domain-containing protein [Serinibacter arcticus]PWD51788.1 hypothetical protein C8046_15180 [Serinibacter arcticus]
MRLRSSGRHAERRSARRRQLRSLSAAVVTTALVLAGGSSAIAGPADSSRASAQFLSGGILTGIDLDDVVGLGGSAAVNNGQSFDVVDAADLDLTALNLLGVSLPGGLDLPLGDVLQLGAVNQYAEASDLGVSRAASGAVSDDGAVSVSGGDGFPASAGLRLQPLLGPLSSTIGDLQLDLEAVTGVASLDASQVGDPAEECTDLSDPTHCLDYSIAGGELRVDLPAITTLTATLTGPGGVASTVDGTVDELVGPNGLIAGALVTLNSALEPLIGNDALTVTLETDVTGALNAVLDTPLTEDGSAVSINLRTGRITADLDALLSSTPGVGTGLANLDPSTEILSAPVLAELVSQVTGLLNQVPELVNTALTETLQAADLTVAANVCLAGSAPDCTTPFVDLGTGINVNVSGTVQQLIDRDPEATATITVKALGLPITISADALLSTLLAPITTALFDPTTGVIATVTGSTSALTGAVTGVIGGLATPLQAINGIVSILGNVQQHSGGVHRETALSVTLLGGIAGGVVVNLGQAQVGENVVVTVPTADALSPTSGPAAGGQTVTVTGSGFVAGQTSVTIGGITVPADSVAVTSATSLTFTTPAHAAGPVDVTVTSLGGTTAPLGYTYVAAPTAASIAPAFGPVAGGQTVTINGSGFVVGATTVTIDGLTVPATVNSPVQLTFVTPAHAAGPVQVTATTPGGTSGALTYTYLDTPVASSLTPDAGPIAGGQSVTITGDGFVAGLTWVNVDGVQLPLSSVSVTSSTSLTFTTPAHAVGPVPVTVTTLGGTSAPLTYTYVDQPVTFFLTPPSGPEAGGNNVLVIGDRFVPGATTVAIDGAPVPGTVIVLNPTILLYTAPAHAPGPVAVTVTTAGGTSAPLVYTYLPAPSIAGLDPTSGPVAGGTSVTVTGEDFTPDAFVAVDGVPVDAADVTVVSETELTYVSPAHPAGAVDVTVTTPGGTSAPLTFTYLDAPTLSTLDPDSGPVAGGTTVTVSGAGFVAGAFVTVDGVPVDAADVTVVSETELTYVSPAHPAGAVDVTVTTPGGTSAPLTFTYLDAPTLSTLDPDSGPVAGGTTVTVSGAGFVAGTVVTVDGTDVPAADVTVVSETELTYVSPAHPAGAVDVTVTTPGGTSAPLTFTYLDAPTAASLTPEQGPVEGGTTVTVTGTDFVPGAVVTVDGTEVPAADVAVVSESELTYVSPAHPAGAVDVTVTTPGGTSAPLTFTYLDAPTAASLTPEQGPVEGGTTVTVTGTDFVPGAVVTVDGIEVPAADVTVVSETELTYVSPAHPAGAVDVTVTTPGGTSAPLTFTYLDAPTAGSLTPDSGPIAGGNLVVVTGTGFTPGTVVTVDGLPASVTVESATQLTYLAPAHPAGPVDVVVTTAGAPPPR